MRLLLDQCLSRSAAGLLRGAGHDAVHVGDLGQSKADDAQIIQLARQEQRTIVTLDADFHAELARTSATGPSVVWLRLEHLSAELATTLVLTAINQCGPDLAGGALVTVYEERIKVHSLPIVPSSRC